jgi:hypothetical protein
VLKATESGVFIVSDSALVWPPFVAHAVRDARLLLCPASWQLSVAMQVACVVCSLRLRAALIRCTALFMGKQHTFAYIASVMVLSSICMLQLATAAAESSRHVRLL